MNLKLVFFCSASILYGTTLGCRGSAEDGTIDAEYVGDPCAANTECYSDIDQTALSGPAVCLTNVTNGYCTHECTVDEDCCAVPGECVTDLPQVCAPLESMNDAAYCLVTCEDTQDAETPDSFCQRYVHPDFNCRSTGGGSDNRKVCLPN